MPQLGSLPERVDAVVIGGGFYGSAIAVYLAKQRGLRDILLIEREAALLTRSSYKNQARVHNGYHYPRSLTTAYRSRIHAPNFVRDWPSAVKRDFTKIYAIARHNSKVTPRQFEHFCHRIGAPLEPADIRQRELFEPRLIEAVYVAEEYAFDVGQLARNATEELEQCGVRVQLETEATAISADGGGGLKITLASIGGQEGSVTCRYAFNCTYSGLGQIGGGFPKLRTPLKHEIAELALMAVPPAICNYGITVMDGPFFSVMPFPPKALHTLSHVRYTPHLHWSDEPGLKPHQRLRDYDRGTRVNRMVIDAGRYLPAILDAKYVESLFEVKTVLERNEIDDGRPILFEKHRELPGCYSVLGGKLDNVYDILERLGAEEFS